MNTNDFWYNEQHQLRFTVGSTTYSTWSNWHLIPTNKPIIDAEDDSLSQIKMKYADAAKTIVNSIPLSGVLKGSAEFIITSNNPETVYASIKSTLHCKYGQITFADSSVVYNALITVGNYSPKESFSTVTIDYVGTSTNANIPSLSITKPSGQSTASVNTWSGWHLIPTSFPVPSTGDDNSKYITINYVDGSEKKVRISDKKEGVRTGSLEFVIVSSSPESTYGTVMSWLNNAKNVTIVFPSNLGTYYGTLRLSKFTDNDKFGVIGFDYELYDAASDAKDASELTASEAHNISITIGSTTYNTWTNWSLISEEPIVLDPPEVKTNYVSIPGLNGSIDLTEALTGNPTYDNVTGSITFTATASDPLSTYRTIMSAIHGKAGSISTEGSMSAQGRFSVDGWSASDGIFKITIGYNVKPYIGS